MMMSYYYYKTAILTISHIIICHIIPCHIISHSYHIIFTFRLCILPVRYWKFMEPFLQLENTSLQSWNHLGMAGWSWVPCAAATEIQGGRMTALRSWAVLFNTVGFDGFWLVTFTLVFAVLNIANHYVRYWYSKFWHVLTPLLICHVKHAAWLLNMYSHINHWVSCAGCARHRQFRLVDSRWATQKVSSMSLRSANQVRACEM